MTRIRWFAAGFVVGLLLLSVGLGKANAYARTKHVVYSVFPPAREPVRAAGRAGGADAVRVPPLAVYFRLHGLLQPQAGQVASIGRGLELTGWSPVPSAALTT